MGVRGDGFRIGEEEKGSLENEKEKKERAERRNSWVTLPSVRKIVYSYRDVGPFYKITLIKFYFTRHTKVIPHLSNFNTITCFTVIFYFILLCILFHYKSNKISKVIK